MGSDKKDRKNLRQKISDTVEALGGWSAAWRIISPRMSTVILVVVLIASIVLFPSDRWDGDLLGSKKFGDDKTVTETFTPPVHAPTAGDSSSTSTSVSPTESSTVPEPTVSDSPVSEVPSDMNTPTIGSDPAVGNTGGAQPQSSYNQPQGGGANPGYSNTPSYTPRQTPQRSPQSSSPRVQPSTSVPQTNGDAPTVQPSVTQ